MEHISTYLESFMSELKKKAADRESTVGGETHNETQVIAAVRGEKIMRPAPARCAPSRQGVILGE